MLLPILIFLAATQSPLEELRRLELDIETAKMSIPPTFDREAEEKVFRKLIEVTKLDATVNFEKVAAASPLELWRVEIAGRGDVDAVAFLLDMVATRKSRLATLESLRIEDGTFKARITLPVFPADTMVTGGLQDRLARSRALHEAIDRLQGSKRLEDAAALLQAWPDEPTVRMTAADFGEAMRVEGVSLGAAARASLLDTLKAAGFAVTRMQMPPAGACRPFVLTAMYGSMPAQIVNDATLRSPLCDGEAVPAAGRIAARGSDGPLTVSLRDVELSAVFQLLSELTGESFLVDANVQARVDVELEKATIEEALAAIKGVYVTAEPLRRVSLVPRPALTRSYTGEPISMLLTDADLPSVLCLFEDITALKSMIAPDTSARVIVFARDVPWDRLFEAMTVSAGLTYKIDGTEVLLAPRATAVDACSVAGKNPSRFSSGAVTLEQLAKSDVTVAGVVQQDGKWMAWLRGPRHRYWLAEPGQALFDTKVKSVDATGVTFE